MACRDGFALINNTCNQCGSGYYLTNRSCQVCPITCETCSLSDSSGSTPVCLSCDVPLVLDNGFCVDTSGALYDAQIFKDVKTSLEGSWNIYPNLQQFGIDSCANRTILGSSTIKFKFLTMSRNYTNLPTHSGVVILMHFYQIDDYAND